MLGRYPRVTYVPMTHVWRMGSISTYEENKVLKFAAFDVLTALPIADCDQDQLWNGLILQLNNYWPANQLAVWRRFILEYLFNFWTVCMLPFFGFVETLTVRTHFLGTISCGKSTKSFPANGHFSDDVKTCTICTGEKIMVKILKIGTNWVFFFCLQGQGHEIRMAWKWMDKHD